VNQPVGLEAKLRADRRQIPGIWIDAVPERPRLFVVVREVSAVPLSGHLRQSARQHKERAEPDYGQDRGLTHRGRDSFAVHAQV
jgi:hypothetical protein